MSTVLTRGSLPGSAVRTFVLFGPMAAWFAHLNVSYLLVPWSCRWGHAWGLHAATVVLAVVAATGTWLAVRLAGARPGRELPDDRPGARTGPFLGFYGAVLGGLFTLTILVQGMGNLVIDPCAQ